MPNYDDLAQALASEGAAFGVFPQMSGRRRLQDAEAAKNIPVDILGGIVSSGLGAIPSGIKLLSDIRNAGRDDRPSAEIPGGIDYWLDKMPFKGEAPVNKAAAQLGSMLPINPAPAYRALGNVGKATTSLLGNELARGMYGNEGSLANVIPTAMKPRFATEPQMQMAQTITKPKAEVSPLGFYSAVEQQALNIPRKQGTGESFLNDLAKGQDVKKYEIEAMGLDEFLKGKPNVTRQEVQDFIANNKLDVQERQLSGRGDKSGVFSEFNPDKNQFMVYGEDLSHTHAFNTAEEADNFVKQFNSQIPYGPSKYDKYQLPGGENYREILLTLPFKEPAMPKGYEVTSMQYDDGTVRYFANTPTTRSQGFRTQEEAQAELSKTASNLKDFRESLVSYQSSHFDEPNVLAHMRVNDRVDAEGKKMLLIEEVQSDWHQAGREQGYTDAKAQAQAQEKITALKEEHRVLGQLKELTTNETERNAIAQKRFDLMNQAQELSKVGTSGVPDAPFKDTWHQLALKRAIKEAVDKGYDRIGLTTGAQQAERYDLSKQIDLIDYRRSSNNTFELGVVGKNGEPVDLPKRFYTAEELPSVLGKEVADKIVKGEGQKGGGRTTLRGLDLQVGGEGMKKYYDEIYPNYLNKLGKKYGSQVGETRIKTGRGVPGGEPVRYLDITPEMRKAIKEGQPLASIEEELAKALA